MATTNGVPRRRSAFPRVRLLKSARATGGQLVSSSPPIEEPGPRQVETVSLTVNGGKHQLDVRTNETLVDTLRDRLELKGTKVGCDDGSCGTCTVLLEGQPVYACMVLSIDCEEQSIDTIEGLGTEDGPHALQVAFADGYAAQCGFCTPGAIMAAKALLDRTPDPTETDVRLGLSGVICRCGYRKIIEATLDAARRV